MTAKITPDMTVLSETLLIPLWAKAVEQERDERLLTDPEAPRMLAQIDYDFSKFKNIVMSQVGCCGRAQIFDNEAQKFIAAHPDAVVVQLGAGLDARFERLGRPQITAWYELEQWLPGLKLEAEMELSRVCGRRYLLIARLIYATKWGRRKMDQHIVRVRLP